MLTVVKKSSTQITTLYYPRGWLINISSDLVDGKRSFKINFSTKTATKKETFLRLDVITTNPVVLLRL